MNTPTSNPANLIESLQLEVSMLKRQLAWYEEQFRLNKHRQFGAASERFDAQGLLFNEAEQQTEDNEDDDQGNKPDDTRPVAAHQRKKPVRTELPKDLPRDIRILDVPEEEKWCACCEIFRKKIGFDASCKLEIIPPQFKVIEYRRIKYGCACENGIVTAPMVAMPIPKSIATPGLLAWVMTNKYCDALPLYRQEFILKRIGAEISRATLAQWMIRCAELLEPIYQALHKQLVEQSQLHADETTNQVLKEPGRAPQSNSYLWVYRTAETLDKAIILYDYQTGRGHQHPETFLSGFSGYLHCDGHSAYKTLSNRNPDILLVGCMAHVRRKFADVVKATPKGEKPTRARQALKMIQRLYGIERDIKDKPPNERYRVRQTESRPILDEMKTWLDQLQPLVPPKSLLGKAVTYALNQWSFVIRYLEDGLLAIDNNAAERAIKPVVVGRKNWLFAHSVKGANASAILYSLIETAKANSLESYAWLRHVLTEIPRLNKGVCIDHLLPIKKYLLNNN